MNERPLETGKTTQPRIQVGLDGPNLARHFTEFRQRTLFLVP